MTARDALAQAVTEMQAIPYKIEVKDEWNHLQEMLARRGDDCDGHAAGCIERVWTLADEPKPGLRYMLGMVGDTGHAWVGMDLPDGEELWADPTPGYHAHPEPPGYWTGRTLRAWAPYDGRIWTSLEEV